MSCALTVFLESIVLAETQSINHLFVGVKSEVWREEGVALSSLACTHARRSKIPTYSTHIHMYKFGDGPPFQRSSSVKDFSI